MTDRTINTGGEANMMPRAVPFSDPTTEMVDSFIRDGWMHSDDKWLEVAKMYRGAASAARREASKQRDLRFDIKAARFAEEYAAAWPARWLDDQAALRGQ